MKAAQWVRFLVVGSLNTGCSYLLYAALLLLGLPFYAASLGSLIGGIVLSFHTQGRFVFGNRDRSRFGRFVLTWLLIYGANVLVIALLVGLGLNAYWAGALALLPTTLLSFVAQKYFVFAAEKPMPRAS